jgi:hypothetical protein
MSSKNDICNMSLSSMGNYGTVSDIDTPTDDKERAFAVWYDVCRQFVLKQLMPNFALAKDTTAQLAEVPPFGYAYYYAYPQNALKILGVGNVEDKENNYNIERTPQGVKAIGHDYDYTEGMPIRFIIDVEDINSWSVEAKILLSQYLAAYTCMQITNDAAKAKKLKDELPAEISSASGLNAQENVPIRISNSRFKAARFNNNPNFTSKK